MITGYDIFRLASALKIEPIEVIKKYTRGYVGNNSKLPVLVLKERPDGSCSLLRNGKCSVHSNKPTNRLRYIPLRKVLFNRRR